MLKLQFDLKLFHFGADRAAIASPASATLFAKGAAHEPDGGDADSYEREDGLDFRSHGKSEAERGAGLVDNKRQNPRGASHVTDLEKRPSPRICFTPHHGNRRHALHGEDIEDHERETHERSEERATIRPLRTGERIAQRRGIFTIILGIEDYAHGRNEYFARGE